MRASFKISLKNLWEVFRGGFLRSFLQGFLKAFLAILKKDFIAYRRGFLFVPLILAGLIFIFTILQLTTSGLERLLFLNRILPITSLEIFSVFYGLSQTIFVPFLLVVISFYFAESFYADTRHQNLLFYKSLPVSDSTHGLAKLFTGFITLPALIWGTTVCLGALFALLLPLLGQANSVLAVIFAFVSMSLSGAAILMVTLVWYAPLFALFALLGQFMGRWALPTAIGGLLTFVLAEKIILFGQSNTLSDLIWQRFDLPFSQEQFASLIDFHFRAQLLNVLRLLREICATTSMGFGIISAIIFVYIAIFYRRHRAIR